MYVLIGSPLAYNNNRSRKFKDMAGLFGYITTSWLIHTKWHQEEQRRVPEEGRNENH